MTLSYAVDRSLDCVKIDTDNWISDCNSLQRYRMSGRTITTFVTEILDANISKDNSEAYEFLLKGSYILIPHVLAELARSRFYTIEDKKYYDMPITQIAGVFEDSILDINHLNLLHDYVLIKKVDLSERGILQYSTDSSTVGKVIKVGSIQLSTSDAKPLFVSVGDTVLLQDNVATEVRIKGDTYLLARESSVVGIFDDEQEIAIENMELINESVLMQEYKSDSLFNSSYLVAPKINYEELDIADAYNRDIFKIVVSDKNLHELKRNDIILTNRDITFYVYFNNQKYFLVNGMKNIYGKVNEER